MPYAHALKISVAAHSARMHSQKLFQLPASTAMVNPVMVR